MIQLGSSGEADHERDGLRAPDSSGHVQPVIILAIDDDQGILGFYKKAMSGDGVRFESSTDSRQTLDLVASLEPNLVILDLAMPGINGLELLHQIKNRDPNTRVAMITGQYTIESALQAIRDGAIDYICKPVSIEKLRELATRVRDLAAQEERTRDLERELADVSNLEGLIGRSPRMLEVFDLMQRVAPHFRTALIAGEPGSGRKLAARALHNLSPARRQRFAIFKSESGSGTQREYQPSWQPLGVFTTEVVSERELFETPFSGTVFVEEVADLYVPTQLRLLRLIDQVWDQEVTPRVGAALRVIASTRQDLEAETQAGRFPPGLWERLRAVQIRLPPLRERREDILLLARHFLGRFSAQYGKQVRRMSRGAEVAVAAYAWPRNVAELENVINKACKLAEGNVVDCGDLPAGVVLPGYGDDFLVRHGASLRAAIGQKASATPTLREKVRGIVDR